jgi:RNA polymerase sigma-70 factor (ECF subfamily)
METDLSDEELIEKILKSNDTALFGQLYDRYSTIVFNLCLNLLREKHEAEDITHDVFLRLYVQLRKFSGKSKFKTWLYRLTYNFCINHIQRNRSKEAADLDEEYDLQEYPDESLMNLKIDVLQKALDLIDINDKAILLMKYQNGLSIDQIMEVLELGKSATKMRIKRAKAKLIEQYNLITK